MNSLHDNFKGLFGRQKIAETELPACISANLRSAYGQRAYQTEAFKRFVCLWNDGCKSGSRMPSHLLYNMATGSGKTLVMAGLMLFLHEKGYRNFLVVVPSNTIINKTTENFLNAGSTKYLFNDRIAIGGKTVFIKETEIFESADTENINIKFTTIQQLHIDLNHARENSVTYEDFADKELVLVADEAHHLNSGTRNKGELFGSWEGTVLELLKQNSKNILLEFTATLDRESKEIVKKYEDKVIYKYDLAEFRADKYSKEINLIRSFYGERERIVQALILNLYRQELATSNGINLKPVILFKAKSKIKESERNKSNFHVLIEEMSPALIETIKNTSTVPIVQKAFAFFDAGAISPAEISDRIKWNFRVENCISANNDKEAELNQIRLNTLESENNPIRAVFAVHKLNEGWDVLNLFDIVRLYEGQNSGGSNKTIGTATLSEAQLIGRGARYFPFALEEGQDKFMRKYDMDPGNDVKILEELYYHTKEDSRYISELKKALIDTGIYDDDERMVTRILTLKPEFKESDFYKTGQVIFNKRIPKDHKKIHSLKDFGIARKNYRHHLSSGAGKVSSAFNNEEESGMARSEKNLKIADIPRHIIRSALANNRFFYFDKLQKIFPNIKSVSDFIKDSNYLGGLEITFVNSRDTVSEINNQDYLFSIETLLRAIEKELKDNDTEYEGSDYTTAHVHAVFKDKTIKVFKESERSEGQPDITTEAWYAYNDNFGTGEEKAFVRMFAGIKETLESRFKDIFLVRNEGDLGITDEHGKTFRPDFILFCKQKADKELAYQVFIEPKGAHLIGHDAWKENFLKKIKDEAKVIVVSSGACILTAVPFYNYENENEFKRSLETSLDHTNGSPSLQAS